VGPETHHVYRDVRDDYFEQMTGEVKAPHKSSKGRKVWQKKSGRAVEAWDCEVYALHGARAKRVHLKRPQDWDAIEQKILQSDLFAEPLEANASNPSPAYKSVAKTVVGQEPDQKPGQKPQASTPKVTVSIKKTGGRSFADIGKEINEL
jgi:phage terminase large subunit GpA-like protein